MKERREPWYWSDNDVDPWSRKAITLSFLLLVCMFAPVGLMSGTWIVEAERTGRSSSLVFESVGAFLAAALAFVLTIVIHELGHLVAGQRHGLHIRYIMLFGVTYDSKEKKFIRVPGLAGALGAVMFDHATEDLSAFRSMIRGGITLNLITVPFATGCAMIQGVPELVRIFAASTALFSFGFAIINALPFRLSTSVVSDGYLLRWLRKDAPAIKRQLEWPDHMQTYFFCSPRDWDLSVLLDKHASPEDYPLRQMLRLIHAQDQRDSRLVGEILEESLSHWPRGEPGNLTGALLGEAALFFTETVDHPARAKHYEERVNRNLQQPLLELAPLKVTRLVRSGKRKAAEKLVSSLLQSLESAPPALRENSRRRYAAILESTAPEFTAEEWAEIRRSRLGDA